MTVFQSCAAPVTLSREEGGLFNDSQSVQWSSVSGEPAPEGYNLTPPSMPFSYTHLRSVINTAFPTITHIASNRDKQVFFVCDKAGNLVYVDE